jgi:hypothetical protein
MSVGAGGFGTALVEYKFYLKRLTISSYFFRRDGHLDLQIEKEEFRRTSIVNNVYISGIRITGAL